MSSRRTWWIWAALGAIALRATCGGCGGSGLRVGTFNIENYPQSQRQVEGAFRAIDALDVAALGVQEITEPEAFARAARERLGDEWRFAFPAESPPQRVGVLYDGADLELVATQTHRETLVYDGGKPMFEARLRGRDDGAVLRLFVVHLKAAGDGGDVRRRQLRAIRPVIAAAASSGDRVVLLGDFNATGPGDRDEIAALAAAAGMTWASRELACTSYWDRDDGCLGSALDHVLASEAARSIAARGPCETDGCDRRDRCPAFHDEVSDHCPVTLDL
jgi:exonuclease III